MRGSEYNLELLDFLLNSNRGSHVLFLRSSARHRLDATPGTCAARIICPPPAVEEPVAIFLLYGASFERYGATWTIRLII